MSRTAHSCVLRPWAFFSSRCSRHSPPNWGSSACLGPSVCSDIEHSALPPTSLPISGSRYCSIQDRSLRFRPPICLQTPLIRARGGRRGPGSVPGEDSTGQIPLHASVAPMSGMTFSVFGVVSSGTKGDAERTRAGPLDIVHSNTLERLAGSGGLTARP